MAIKPLPAASDRRLLTVPASANAPAGAALAAASDWRTTLPVLTTARVTLRELRVSDAPALLQMLTTEEVTRFISAPPTTAGGFERFIEWSTAQRAAGEYLCYGVVPNGGDTPVGIIQVRRLARDLDVAEWGFALGQLYWGTGLFHEAAELALAFAFETVGVRRLEARAAVANARGNGALGKLGAVREGVLRKAFSCGGRRIDQALWSILAAEWTPRSRPATTVH